MTQPRRLNVVQIGLFRFGGARRKLMRSTGLFNILACYDLNPKAMAACQQEDGALPVRSYEELLDTPGAEAVIISTGAKFHAEQTLAALHRGLHVFVEKPLCSTPQEMADLLAAQRRTGRVVGVGHNDHRCDAISATIKGMIDRGELGRVATFEQTTAHSGGLVMKPGEWRADPQKNPGGMLFQCGVHSVHELMYYFGPIRRIAAQMRYDVHTTQTADVALCHVEFDSGLVGCLNAYHVTPYRHTFSIFGTKTNIYREDLCFGHKPLLFTQTTRLDHNEEPKLPLELTGTTDPTGNLRSFHDAVVNGRPCYPSIVDGARAVAAVFAAETSARAGRVVDVERVDELVAAD